MISHKMLVSVKLAYVILRLWEEARREFRNEIGQLQVCAAVYWAPLREESVSVVEKATQH
jgi:hypothetical protein